MSVELTANAVMKSINSSAAPQLTHLNNFLVKLSLFFMCVQSTGEAEKEISILRTDVSLSQ